MDLSKIKLDIESLFKDKEIFLYSVEYGIKNEINTLIITFDKNGFIDSDEIVSCTDIVNEYLDKTDPISEEYYLEVTSRGIEKEIKFEEAKYYLKENVHVKTLDQLFKGILSEVGSDYLGIKDKKNKLIKIKANDIESINIVAFI